MDSYLESLVLKTNKPSNDEDITSSEIDQEVDTDSVTVVGDNSFPEFETKTDSSGEVIELNFNDDVIDNKVEIKSGDATNIEPIAATSDNSTVSNDESTSLNLDISVGQIINIAKPIRVFKTPDTKQISKNVVGNVTYLGKIGDFNIINYMKHGFGLVRGYTLDDLV